MNEHDLAAERRRVVMKLVEHRLDKTSLAIVESVLLADERMAIIRDLFIEGKRDHEAVQQIRDLAPDGRWGLLPASNYIQIVPTQTVSVICRPQISFLPQYLLVSRSCADFMINDIRVGNRSEFVQAGDVPADPFVVDSPSLDVALQDASNDVPITIKIDRTGSQLLGVRLDLETVYVGMELIMIVTNMSDEAKPFRAAWLGQQQPWKEYTP